MIRYVIRRILGAILVVIVSTFVTFGIFFYGPKWSGQNIALFYIGKIPSKNAERLVNERFGFNKPFFVQYWDWLHGIFAGRNLSDGTGDNIHCAAPCLGYSFRLNLPVSHLIGQALPIELSLATGAAILWLIGGVAIGTVSALRKGSFWDRAGMTLALAGVSLPIFFTGPLLKLIFQYQLKWIPIQGYVSFFDDPLRWFQAFILAWLALAFLYAALYARLTRANMLETMSEDYIRTARAKGLPRRDVVTRHGLRAALTPIITIFGLDVGQLIGSAVITETVFNLHGLGWLAINAIQSQDLPITLGVTLIATLAVVVANIVVDVLYAVVDPRVSYS